MRVSVGEQDRQGDLVGGLLARGALDEGDHPVDEGLAGLAGDSHDDPVGQHRRAAGDGAAVAAGLADDRCGLAGDRRLVDGGDALDDVAVAGDDLAGLDDHEVAEAQRGAGDLLVGAVVAQPRGRVVSVRVLRSVVGLGLAASLGHGLGEVGEEDGRPQPERDRAGEPLRVARRRRRRWS